MVDMINDEKDSSSDVGSDEGRERRETIELDRSFMKNFAYPKLGFGNSRERTDPIEWVP